MAARLSKIFNQSVQSAKRAFRSSKSLRLAASLAITAAIGLALLVLFKVEEPTGGKTLDPDHVTAFLTALSIDNRRALPVVFIDVDELSYQSWGSPRSIPRQNLADLLVIAEAGKPAAVVLDFDITLDSETEVEPIRRHLTRPGQRTVPLWLVRPLRTLAQGHDVPGAVLDRGNNVIDPLIRPEKGTRWVSAYLDTEKDWFQRRWRAYHAVCADGSRAYPSVALAASAITRNADGSTRKLDEWLEEKAGSHCGQRPSYATTAEPRDWLRNAGSSMTIPYGVGFTSELRRFGTTTVGDKVVPTFSRFSAKNLIDRKQALQSDEPLDLSGRIVIIGASYEASGDWHRTPLGRMPGMYILGNLVAFGAEALEENRWWGLKPFLLGLALLTLHAFAALLFRGPIALAVTLGGAALLIVLVVRFGMAPATAYDGALMGLGLIALYASAGALIKSFAYGRRYPRVSGLAHYVLSDDSRKWLSTRRGEK